MSGHTPGPWIVGKGIAFSTSVYAGSTMVAFAREDTSRIDWPTAIANARLIAAAPEVVEAAQLLLERLYRSLLPSDGARPLASVEWQDACEKADGLRDAIAKASMTPTTHEERSE